MSVNECVINKVLVNVAPLLSDAVNVLDSEKVFDSVNVFDLVNVLDSEKVFDSVNVFDLVNVFDSEKVFDPVNVFDLVNVFDSVNVSVDIGMHSSRVVPLDTFKSPNVVS